MQPFSSVFEFIRNLWVKVVLFIAEPIFPLILPDPYTRAGNVRVDSKPTHESRVTMTEIIAPHHCNVRGLATAGIIMGWVDIAAGIAAKRHASAPSVTRSVDDVAFLHPVKNGDILTIQASVNKAWRTSMEVGVKVEAQTPLTGERFFVAHAYLTFVALSPRPQPKSYLGIKWMEHRPTRVPEVVPHSIMEKKRHEMAEKRRQARFHEKKKPSLQSIRDLMREWSQGLRTYAFQNTAAIRSHPALYATQDEDEDERTEDSGAQSDTVKDDDDAHSDLGVDDKKRKRYSMDPVMQLPFKETQMETTFAEVVELVMPQHANTLSITFGGQIMAWMEACALASANRLSRAYLLTASIDSLSFITPTHVGDVVTIRSIVSRAYTSSMEVYVSVEAENLQTSETNFTNDAFFTIVAIDKDHIPVKIPRAVPQTEAEMKLFEGGPERRAKRLGQRVDLINLVSSASECIDPPDHMSIPISPS
ncbi:HotDog domain-containing protein [Fennellomyces sp. T-0311]|nr:HotDog domain-containing protein [Fennellomyces sp. T-0311]